MEAGGNDKVAQCGRAGGIFFLNKMALMYNRQLITV